jgi:hypothetical protein
MDHGTRDKSARLILASVPVQALLMAGVLALALGGRPAAPAPGGAFSAKPVPAHGPALCKMDLLPAQGALGGQSASVKTERAGGPAWHSSPVLGAPRCPAGRMVLMHDSTGSITWMYEPVTP